MKTPLEGYRMVKRGTIKMDDYVCYTKCGNLEWQLAQGLIGRKIVKDGWIVCRRIIEKPTKSVKKGYRLVKSGTVQEGDFVRQISCLTDWEPALGLVGRAIVNGITGVYDSFTVCRKIVKKPKITTWLIVNDNDANDSFEVEAVTLEQAKTEALKELGWWVARQD